MIEKRIYRPEVVTIANIMDYRITFCVLLLATFIVAQNTEDKKDTFLKKLPVRLGSDGRPLLFAPKIEMCMNRKYSYPVIKITSQSYIFN